MQQSMQSVAIVLASLSLLLQPRAIEARLLAAQERNATNRTEVTNGTATNRTDVTNGTYDDWKAERANARAAAAAAAAREKKVAAVRKVIELLDTLVAKVSKEGEKEAQSYNEFACFCKTATKERLEAIGVGGQERTTLTAKIGALTSKRDELDTLIGEIQDNIAQTEDAMQAAKKTRAAERKVYVANEADLSAALSALDEAIKALKTSKSPSFAQYQAMAKTVRAMAGLADTMGLSGEPVQHAVSLFLQQSPEVPMEDYKFHSHDIIETLEQLRGDFFNKKADVDKEEVSLAAAHDSDMQEKTDHIKAKNLELGSAQKKRSLRIADIATSEGELTLVSATLLEDQEYLERLSKMCADKALTWDSRSRVRLDELNALYAAASIIKSSVYGNTTAATIRLVQQGARIYIADAVAKNENAMEAIEADTERSAPSFLQRRSNKPTASLMSLMRQWPGAAASRVAGATSTAPDMGRQAIVSLLRSQGARLQSTLLTSLASRVAADPFGKVKKLIQELIERLLQEAGNEANQKGWCDKATSDAQQKRDYAAEEVRDLNGQMAQLEAKLATLTEEIEALTKAIDGLNTLRAEAVRLRAAESAENAQTVSDAKDGQSAVEQAIEVLDRFYKTSAKTSIDLSLAQGPKDDAPDAGFKIGEAYLGAQGDGSGILGMMDVIRSDFVRTISATQKAERQAQQDHLEYMTESGKSLAQKTVDKNERSNWKADAGEKLGAAEESMDAQKVLLEGAVKELIQLKAQCVDTGMSYADRVSQREEEIEALKKALCILKAYELYGPDGATDAC